ncbi:MULTISPECIES: recombinase family protein [Halorussus]|uniref:recombinase family protein n=1 Tax=Halorussus TaxID=1070314 RepID=UPI00209CC79A|nr:recombinase family protein [Halorussus vallis]USZ74061.1 recombinase family protein [Halorussus vallis]
MTEKLESVAVYIRRSTADQDDEHQRDDIVDWLDRHNLVLGDVDLYADQASGSTAERDQFLALVEGIEHGDYSDVVVWEVSRIARKGLLAQRFFDAAEDSETTIHVTNGSVREIRPDGTGRLVADIIASVAAEERRALIRRTQSGQRRARQQGKWLGQVPAGFARDDGYLKPNIDPDYAEGETGYFDIAEALDAIDRGESYNAVAKRTPNVTRQTLSNIDQDDERRCWYTDATSDDERVDDALDSVR